MYSIYYRKGYKKQRNADELSTDSVAPLSFGNISSKHVVLFQLIKQVSKDENKYTVKHSRLLPNPKQSSTLKTTETYIKSTGYTQRWWGHYNSIAITQNLTFRWNNKKYESTCIFLLNSDTFLSCPTILVLREIKWRNPSLLNHKQHKVSERAAGDGIQLGNIRENDTLSSHLTPPEFKYFHQSDISASWNAPITWILATNRNNAKLISLAPYLECPSPFQFPRFRKQAW